MLCHVFGYRGLPDIDAKLEEFTVNARRTPERVREAHFADESSDLMWCPGPATTRVVISSTNRLENQRDANGSPSPA